MAVLEEQSENLDLKVGDIEIEQEAQVEINHREEAESHPWMDDCIILDGYDSDIHFRVIDIDIFEQQAIVARTLSNGKIEEITCNFSQIEIYKRGKRFTKYIASLDSLQTEEEKTASIKQDFADDEQTLYCESCEQNTLHKKLICSICSNSSEIPEIPEI